MNNPFQKRKVQRYYIIKVELLKTKLHFQGNVSMSRCLHFGLRGSEDLLGEKGEDDSVDKMLVTQAGGPEF